MRILSPCPLLLLCVSQLGAQVPFLRGDANDDGRVSLADAYYIARWLHDGGPQPPCVKAADANDDGKIRNSGTLGNAGNDVHAIAISISCGDSQYSDVTGCWDHDIIAAPRDAPGDDPTPDGLPCDAYTAKVQPVEDPTAKLEILHASCPGGQNDLAILKLRLSNARPIGGYWGTFDALGIFAEVAMFTGVLDIDPRPGGGGAPLHAAVNRGQVFFVGLGNPRLSSPMPPGSDVLVLKIYLRLEPGTRAGVYPISLVAGELVDHATGQSVFPSLVDGLLDIEADVAADATPEVNGRQDFCPGLETLTPSGPEDMQVARRMGLVAADRGSRVTVPLWIHANAPIEAFSFAFSYRRDAIQLVRVVARPEARPWDGFQFDATHRSAPDQPLDDVWGQAVFSAVDPAGFLAARVLHHVLDFEFDVLPTAPDAHVEMSLTNFNLDPKLPDRVEWRTGFKAFGQWLESSGITCTDGQRFDDSGILIGLTTTPFLRGDANADGVLSFADAVLIGHGTQSQGPRIRCLDAADANDDGSANYGDAVRIFEHLIESPSAATAIPLPFPAAGADETLDTLPCDEYRVTAAASSDDVVRIGSLDAAPGEPVEVPIYASTSRPLQGYQLVVRYDPAAFTPTGVRVRLDGSPFEVITADSSLNYMASNLLSKHLVVVFSSNMFRQSAVPAGQDILVGKVNGVVSPDAQVGGEIILEPVAFAADDPPRADRLRTELIVIEDVKPVPHLPHLEAGRVRIVDGSEATFLRGDANGDLEVNISDPVFTLGYLFLGGAAPICEDAADADDSGKIELTDAVFTLNFLFSGGARPLPPPHPERGRDGQADGLAPCREVVQ